MLWHKRAVENLCMVKVVTWGPFHGVKFDWSFTFPPPYFTFQNVHLSPMPDYVIYGVSIYTSESAEGFFVGLVCKRTLNPKPYLLHHVSLLTLAKNSLRNSCVHFTYWMHIALIANHGNTFHSISHCCSNIYTKNI